MVVVKSQAAFVDRLTHHDMMLVEANVIEAAQVILIDRRAAVKADDMLDIEAEVLAMQKVELLAALDCAIGALLLLEAVEQVSEALSLVVLSPSRLAS